MKPAIFAFLAASSLVFAAHAQEEAVCMDSLELEAALIDWYGEAPSPDEFSHDTQLWTAGTGGTWTLVKYEPNRQSCVLAQGENYAPEMTGDALVAALE